MRNGGRLSDISYRLDQSDVTVGQIEPHGASQGSNLQHPRQSTLDNSHSPTSQTAVHISCSCSLAKIGRRRRDRDKQGFRLPRWLRRRMGQEESTLVDESVPPETLTERSLSAVADYIKNGPKKRIVVLTGAGISTAAGSKTSARPHYHAETLFLTCPTSSPRFSIPQDRIIQ